MCKGGRIYSGMRDERPKYKGTRLLEATQRRAGIRPRGHAGKPAP